MLNEYEFKQVIKSVKFKDFYFQLSQEQNYEFGNRLFGVELVSMAMDSKNSDNIIRITFERKIYPDNQEAVIRQLFGMIQERIIHEAKEFFKVQDIAVYDEHVNKDMNNDLLEHLLSKGDMNESNNSTRKKIKL